MSQGQTARDANANWVELSGVTAFSPWTVATLPPTVTGATTFVNQETTSGLVITPPVTDTDVAFFKITNIQHGTLFKSNGVSHINNNDFITTSEGAAGLKFNPTTDFSGTGRDDWFRALSL